jgi:hypothetical protein
MTKFHAIRCEEDGFFFHSKKELSYYQDLKKLQKAGQIKFFLMQTPFHLPGKVKYVLDFLVFYTDGEVQFIDVKGVDTPTSKVKRKITQSLYGIDIKIV